MSLVSLIPGSNYPSDSGMTRPTVAQDHVEAAHRDIIQSPGEWMVEFLRHLDNRNKGEPPRSGGKMSIDYTNKQIRFYIAGYTQKIEGQPVQEVHKSIRDKAKKLYDTADASTLRYPFGLETSSPDTFICAYLKHIPNNTYDLHATQIILKVGELLQQRLREHSIPPFTDTEMIAGWVPAHYSAELRYFRPFLGTGRIAKIAEVGRHKHASIRIEFPYGEEFVEEFARPSLDVESFDRFSSVLERI